MARPLTGSPVALEDRRLPEVARALLRRRPRRGAFIVGVTGGVACGKTTFSGALHTRLSADLGPLQIERVCTDGFLFPNAILAARDLSLRKGFPESYDGEAMARALAAVRAGPADFPGYSHITYDRDPALSRRVLSPDILIVEGLGLTIGPAVTPSLDALIYLDADEAAIEAWFVARFLGFWKAGQADPGSFYARFRHLGPQEAEDFARGVWNAINLPNLRQHILPARAKADIVVTKGDDHRIVGVLERRRPAKSCT